MLTERVDRRTWLYWVALVLVLVGLLPELYFQYIFLTSMAASSEPLFSRLETAGYAAVVGLGMRWAIGVLLIVVFVYLAAARTEAARWHLFVVVLSIVQTGFVAVSVSWSGGDAVGVGGAVGTLMGALLQILVTYWFVRMACRRTKLSSSEAAEIMS